MSLDIWFVVDNDTVFEANITHNLNKMAEEAGIYEVIWRPEENFIVVAKNMLPFLFEGVLKMTQDKEHYERFNARNGWGVYEDFLPWLIELIRACVLYPEASVHVCR